MSMSTRIVLPSQGLRLPARPSAGGRCAALVVRAEGKDSYQVCSVCVKLWLLCYTQCLSAHSAVCHTALQPWRLFISLAQVNLSFVGVVTETGGACAR